MTRKYSFRRRDKLIEAFLHFEYEATNKQIISYLKEKYYPEILKTIKPSSLWWSINWQLQFYSFSDGKKNFTGNSDLFYKTKPWLWGMYPDYKDRLKKTPSQNNIFNVAEDLDLNIDQQTKKKSYVISRIVRDSKIISYLKELYNNRCQICSESIDLGNWKLYSEGHHIRPLWIPHNWPDKIENIIILCPNHHTEFDYWAIAIDPHKLTIFHKSKYNKFYNKPIVINDKHNINNLYLAYHLENIYKVI